MSADESLTRADSMASPTSIRHLVLAVTTLMSVLLYLDRFAVNIAAEYIREDLRMTQTQVSWFVSAFFWSYALCQVPAGWLSDRFGARVVLSFYILAWSVFTGLMGIAHSVWALLWLRLFCGVAQAGAYPTAVGLIRHWYPISFRGRASSIIGLGGRMGGVLAPILTAWCIISFVSAHTDPALAVADILDADSFLTRFDRATTVDDKQARDVQRRRFVEAFVKTLAELDRSTLENAAAIATSNVKGRANSDHKSTPNLQRWLGDLVQDWIPVAETKSRDLNSQSPLGLDLLVHAMSISMNSEDFIDVRSPSMNLTEEGQRLRRRRSEGFPLTEAEMTRLNREIVRLNRFGLESLFPLEIRKFQGRGWRPTIILYGIVGVFIAFAFFTIVRIHPQRHPWCNTAEKQLIDDDATQKTRSLEPLNQSFPWRAFLGDLSLWGNSATQFLTNVGWLFVMTSLPRYLDKVHGVTLQTIGFMTAFPIGTGILGMFFGGRWTDGAVRRFGLKWGRRIPLVVSRFTAAGGYGFCLLLGIFVAPSPDRFWLPWLYIAGLCVAATSADLGTPSIWAYCQDVGGKYTASILGWGNMWGNIGAAIAPFIYNRILGETPAIKDWNSVFAVCCAAFAIAGLTGLLLDATRPLTMGLAQTKKGTPIHTQDQGS